MDDDQSETDLSRLQRLQILQLEKRITDLTNRAENELLEWNTKTDKTELTNIDREFGTMFDEIEILPENLQDELRDKLSNRLFMNINKKIGKIVKGKYFSTINQIWEPDPQSFANADLNLFTRTHFVNFSGANGQIDERYKATEEAAGNPNCDLADDSSRTSDQSSYEETNRRTDQSQTKSLTSYYNNAGLDIFKYKSAFQKAHLMPFASPCSKFWFPIVNWVLPPETIPEDDNEKWSYLQKCIHGSKPPKENMVTVNFSYVESDGKADGTEQTATCATKPKNEASQADDGKADGTEQTATCATKPKDEASQTDDDKAYGTEQTATCATKLKDEVSQADDTVDSHTTQKYPKINNVGIQHFPSNIVRLHDQAEFFDRLPGVLIIPILEASAVKKWNGEGYNAIVLAEASGEYEADNIYTGISAVRGSMEITGATDCEKARILLTQAILCFCRSLVDPNNSQAQLFTNRFLDSIVGNENKVVDVAALNREMKTKRRKKKGINEMKIRLVREAIEQFQKSGSVPVPKALTMRNRQDALTVRMVSFTDSTNRNNINPAPDPVLLLAKAMSNWLKRNDLFVLPCTDDDSTTANSDGDSSTLPSTTEEVPNVSVGMPLFVKGNTFFSFDVTDNQGDDMSDINDDVEFE